LQRFFFDWKAHTVYYLDAASNILEFIARYNSPTAVQHPFRLLTDNIQPSFGKAKQAICIKGAKQ